MSERTPSTSSRHTVDRPTRWADQNQDLVDRSDHGSHEHLLPTLKDGITLLDIDGGRGVQIIQSLVLDHLLFHDGRAFWIDASGHATTTTLARIAPSRRLLDRIHVARGFTAYQHYGAVRELPAALDSRPRQTKTDTSTVARQPADGNGDSTGQTPALIVVPAVDVQYRTDDTLRRTQAQTLQARTLARLTSYAEEYRVPVLVTRSQADEFTTAIARAADNYLECKQTTMGPRFVGEEFETLVYPVDDGTYYQSTFAYWRQLLRARAKHTGMDPATPSPSPEETANVGTGVTAGGETTSFTTNPLLDALTAAGQGR